MSFKKMNFKLYLFSACYFVLVSIILNLLYSIESILLSGSLDFLDIFKLKTTEYTKLSLVFAVFSLAVFCFLFIAKKVFKLNMQAKSGTRIVIAGLCVALVAPITKLLLLSWISSYLSQLANCFPTDLTSEQAQLIQTIDKVYTTTHAIFIFAAFFIILLVSVLSYFAALKIAGVYTKGDIKIKFLPIIITVAMGVLVLLFSLLTTSTLMHENTWLIKCQHFATMLSSNYPVIIIMLINIKLIKKNMLKAA